MSRSKIFLFCCIFFILGVGIASFLPPGWMRQYLWWFGGMAICGMSVILSRIFNAGTRHALSVWTVFLFGFFLFSGLWRYTVGLPQNTPDKIWYYNGQTVAVTGIVANEPDRRQANQKLEIEVYNVETQNFVSLHPVTGKVLITTNLYPEYSYGDILEFTCELDTPEDFEGFAYDRYLARYDIYSVCYYPLLHQSDGKQALTVIVRVKILFYTETFALKGQLREVIDRGLGDPEAGLARAILLGDKRGIPEELRVNFSRAGISHIVAISGMHISILSALVFGGLLGIGLIRRYAFYAASLFLVSYIILIGVPASAMRAGLMGFLVLWALHLGRLNKLTNALILAGAVLLMVNPRLLRDDVGFQLSFLAVTGIAYVYPVMNRLFERFWKKGGYSPVFRKRSRALAKGVWDVLSVTLAAQVFTLPIIVYNFGVISVVAPLSNLLILWILPVLMVAMSGALGFGLILPKLSAVWFLPARLSLQYIVVMSGCLIKLPLSFAEVDYLWSGWYAVYYGIVIGGLYYFRQGSSEKAR